jgi:hypothetical protein
MKTMRSTMLILLLAAATANVSAQKKADPRGTWSFYAEAAPYGYNSGDIVIGKDGRDYTARIIFGESHEINGQAVVMEKDQLSFQVWIEGERISIKGTVTKEDIQGTATYTEGTISFTAERKKEQEQ